MINCALCKQQKNPKSNTHYLTDYIIRTALNEDGVNIRGKGLYWGIDTANVAVDFKFQQHASTSALEKLLGRITTDDENEDAKKNVDFSVGNVFCKECEDIFTEIENAFEKKVLPKFRESDLSDTKEIILNTEDSEILRLFFLMQFWRTSECDPTFQMAPKISEFLRIQILNKDYEDLDIIPMSVSYLVTEKDSDDEDNGNKYKTQNVVLVQKDTHHKIIMNDFVIQMYESAEIALDDFFGYNSEEDLEKYLNHQQADFKVKVFSNTERKKISKTYFGLSAKKFLADKCLFFFQEYSRIFSALPTNSEVSNFMNSIAKNPDAMLFTDERFSEISNQYFNDVAEYRNKRFK